MKDERKERIVSAIRKYLADKEISQNQLSTELGFISGPQLSNVMNSSKWDKISEDMWQRLDKRFQPVNKKIYKTSNYLAIQKACAEMQELSEVIGFAEYTGAGKSVGAEEYAKVTPNAFYIRCNQLFTRKDLVREIQMQLRIYTEGRLMEMLKDVISTINKLPNPLLIIDEADKLTDANLLLLKVIYDDTKGHCGFVVLGTPVLKERVEKQTKRDKLGWRELRRRFFNQWRRLRRFDFNDAKDGNVVRSEVEQILIDQGITKPSDVEQIMKNATNWGDLFDLINSKRRQMAKALQAESSQAQLELA